jgi:hypothetical protein
VWNGLITVRACTGVDLSLKSPSEIAFSDFRGRSRRMDNDEFMEVWVRVKNKCPHKNTWTLMGSGSMLRLGSSD